MDKQTIIDKFLEKKDLKEHELVYWKHKVSNGFKLKKFMEDFIDYYNEQLIIDGVVQAKPEKVCELIRQKFDDWVFGLETQEGEKLKVVDSTDFKEIIIERD